MMTRDVLATVVLVVPLGVEIDSLLGETDFYCNVGGDRLRFTGRIDHTRELMDEEDYDPTD